MNNFFENHIEEINSITSRSKQESKTTYARLQKGIVYKIRTQNSKIVEEDIFNLEGINVHQFSKDGKVLFGSSDRIYLPDVAIRIYQSLDGLLNSYDTHKVHTTDFKPDRLDNESFSNIEHLELAELDTEYLKNKLENLYSSLPNQLKLETDISLAIEGIYSVWQIHSSENNLKEFDEMILTINYKVESKENNQILINKRKKINLNDLKQKDLDLEDVQREIEFTFDNYKKKLKIISTEKVQPELIVIDDHIISDLLFKLSKSDPEHNLFKHFEIEDVEDIENIEERHDKFGNKFSQEKNQKTLRQSHYSKPAHFINKTFKLNKKAKVSTTQISTIEDIIDILSKKFKSKKILFAFGDKNNIANTDYSNSIILNPAIKFYFDGKGFYQVDADLIEVEDIKAIEFIEDNENHLVKELMPYNLQLGMNGFAYAVIPTKNNLKFI
jgi:hypothetical protein